MMATPSLLEEFALGFSLTAGIINTPKDIYSIEVTEGCRGGKNVDVTIAADCFWHLKERRRSLVGRTGCGLCGVESLSEAVRTAPAVPDTQRFSLAHYQKAIAALRTVQHVRDLTGATHAALWVNPDGTPAGGTEDVGRHVALDKLLGLRAKNGWHDGALVVSSRASYEMVQKAAMCSVEILFAVSAPTRLAVDMAQKCGMTLAAFCRNGGLNVYTHPDRLTGRLTKATTA